MRHWTSAFLFVVVVAAGRGQTDSDFREIWRNTPVSARINSEEEAVRILPGKYVSTLIDTGTNLILFPDHTYANESWRMGSSEITDEGAWRFDDGLIRLEVKRTFRPTKLSAGSQSTYVAWRFPEPQSRVVLIDESFLHSLRTDGVGNAQAFSAADNRRF